MATEGVSTTATLIWDHERQPDGSEQDALAVAQALESLLPDEADGQPVVIRHGSLQGLPPDTLLLEHPRFGAVVLVAGSAQDAARRCAEIERDPGLAHLRAQLARGHWPPAVVVAATPAQPERVARRHISGPLLSREDLSDPVRLNQSLAAVTATTSSNSAPLRPAAAPTTLRIVGGRDRLLFQPPPDVPADEVVRVIDAEQERLAYGLPAGRHILYGVAGSGKTLVLLHRARHLAERHPASRILLTCFNRTLAEALSRRLAGLANVAVANIDRLRTSTNAFDAVLVDEFQDFREWRRSWVQQAIATACDAVLAVDPAQDMWVPPSPFAPPPGDWSHHELGRNYRNTREILELAWRVVEPVVAGTLGAGVMRPEAALRSGPEPEVLPVVGRAAEVDEVCDRVQAWLARGVEPGRIGVFYGNRSRQGRLYYETRRRGIPYFSADFNEEARVKAVDRSDCVRAATIGYLKGLEFSHVAVFGVNDLPVVDADQAELQVAHRRRLYVAMTRATDELFVTVAGDGEIGRAVLDAARP